MDDEIIYSWCFNFVECFDSTPYVAIIVLVENLESLLSLKSQHVVRLSRGRLISNGPPRFRHVACVISNTSNAHPSILIGRSDAFLLVLILAVITLEINR